jgi:hypothetical protein
MHPKMLWAFDHDPDKIVCARQALGRAAGEGGGRVRFDELGLESAEFPVCDVLLLLDVLHYLPREQRLTVLRRAVDALSPRGRLVLRETGQGGGVWVARLLERLGRAFGLNRGPALDFCSPEEYERELTLLGLSLAEARQEGPLDNVLLIFERSGSGTSRPSSEPALEPA